MIDSGVKNAPRAFRSRAVSPVRTVYRLLPLSRRPPPATYPERLGYWPAAVGLFALARLLGRVWTSGHLSATELRAGMGRNCINGNTQCGSTGKNR